LVLLAIAVVAYGLGSRAAQNLAPARATEAQAVPTGRHRGAQQRGEFCGPGLAGTPGAFTRAPIYARVPGYLKS